MATIESGQESQMQLWRQRHWSGPWRCQDQEDSASLPAQLGVGDSVVEKNPIAMTPSFTFAPNLSCVSHWRARLQEPDRCHSASLCSLPLCTGKRRNAACHLSVTTWAAGGAMYFLPPPCGTGVALLERDHLPRSEESSASVVQ